MQSYTKEINHKNMLDASIYIISSFSICHPLPSGVETLIDNRVMATLRTIIHIRLTIIFYCMCINETLHVYKSRDTHREFGRGMSNFLHLYRDGKANELSPTIADLACYFFKPTISPNVTDYFPQWSL